MLWQGNRDRKRRVLNRGDVHSGGWWPPPQSLAISLAEWPERIGLNPERASAGVWGQSFLFQVWRGGGPFLKRTSNHAATISALDESLGKAIPNVKPSVHREPQFLIKS